MEHFPDGYIGVIVGALVNMAMLIWHASSAWGRLRGHDTRIDKLEARTDTHNEKLDKVILDVSNRLGRIETKLELLTGDLPRGRTGPR